MVAFGQNKSYMKGKSSTADKNVFF